MRTRAIALMLLALGGGSAGAQAGAAPGVRTDTLREVTAGWLVGGSIGVPGYRSEPVMELFTIGLHWTRLRPGQPGPDFSVGTMPRAFAEGVVVLGLRAGVALPITVRPGVLLAPSAGASVIAGAGGGGGGGAAGVNGGIAAVMFGAGPIGTRLGVTWHRFGDADGAVWLVELGFVRVR